MELTKQIPISQVFLEDCMKVMARYPDGYFDLAIPDPPYGINIANNASLGLAKYKKHNKKQWDLLIPDDKYFKELFRISKQQIIWGGNYFNLPQTSGWIFWDKQQPEVFDFTFSAGELAWTSFKKPLKKVTIKKSKMQNCVSNNYSVAMSNQKIHITQKPIELYDWIFKNYATEGMKILDTHLGSGSSRIAAHKAKMNFVGCEIDKEYFDASNKRFNEFKAQLTIF
jgi:site-specific DNA-methyltransferase (adenine-specific)